MTTPFFLHTLVVLAVEWIGTFRLDAVGDPVIILERNSVLDKSM